MPRVRVARLENGEHQAAVLPNNRLEPPARLAMLGNADEVKGRLKRLLEEAEVARVEHVRVFLEKRT